MLVKGGKREVAQLAWPMAVGMLSYTLMGVVDTLFMGYVGTNAQAGVGLATTFFFLFLAFFGGIVQGAQSLVAAADGAQDNRRIRLAGGAGVVLGVVCGVVAVLLLAVGYRPLLDLTVSDPQIAAATSRYLQMRLGGLPFTLVGMGLVGVLQGLGDTRTRMWVSLIGNGVNIMLDSVLIFGFYPIPEMGEAGAGLATAISAFVMASLYLMRYVERLKWPIRPTREVVRSAIKLGMPMGAMHAMSVLAFVVMSLILARIGAVHLAASEIVLHVISLSFLPGFGISEAGGILVGRYLGAGEPQTAGRALNSARLLAMILMGACGVLFAVKGDWIVMMFTRDPEVVALAANLMLYAAVFQVCDAIAMVHICALRGAGDTTYTMWVTSLCAWVFTVPCAWFFGMHAGWGAPGAYLGLTLEIIVLSFVTYWRVRRIGQGTLGRLDLLLGEKEPVV